MADLYCWICIHINIRPLLRCVSFFWVTGGSPKCVVWLTCGVTDLLWFLILESDGEGARRRRGWNEIRGTGERWWRRRGKEMIREKMWRKKYGVTATEYAWRWGMIIKSFYYYTKYTYFALLFFFFSLLHVHDALNLATFRKMLSSIFYEILAVLFPHDSLIHRTALQWHLALDNRSVQKRKRL